MPRIPFLALALATPVSVFSPTTYILSFSTPVFLQHRTAITQLSTI